MTDIPFHRLLRVETRKLFDTRSAKIMILVLAGLTVAAIVARGVVAGPRPRMLAGTAGVGFGTLLPALGILAVTGEWGHRTALTTFALEPRRHRVLAAKCLPPLLTAVAASLFALLVTVPVTIVVARVEDVPVDGGFGPLAVLGWTATNVLLVAMGLAIGMLLLNAPLSIVLYLSTPALGTFVGRLGGAGELLVRWFDLNTTVGPLAKGDLSGADAARLAASITFWIVAPMTAGFARGIRREVT
ncbi:hypothetical protein [Actinoallomurus iriomotensis]|uniref:Uncharacterized protein n=1 Tax=Actinoallomurus iriomotensis TaxID=478107 RepID=A0A9W6RZI4_9ACTN|nr:hypothetical protein [Actinoallomurus iriomotensis]GLY84433.1 hypothetical protein Airi02_023620 [Actinoallomurus iriomotensis]